MTQWAVLIGEMVTIMTVTTMPSRKHIGNRFTTVYTQREFYLTQVRSFCLKNPLILLQAFQSEEI